MTAPDLFPVRPEAAAAAWIKAADYSRLYQRSLADPAGFWREQAGRLDWIKPFTSVIEGGFAGDAQVRWFADGVLNASANCLDRHLATRGDQVALIFEGDDPGDSQSVTYRQAHEQVCRLANVLKAHGVRKGDRVTIYLPMILEAAYAMLACARIGAVHSVVFGGFSSDSLKDRILDCEASFLITADEGLRGGRRVPLKASADRAAAACPSLKNVLVVRRTGGKVDWVEGRDLWYDEEMAKVSPLCEPEPMGAEDPLFILYTSGSTGKPKGMVHTTAGYLLHTAVTHRDVFDYKDGEIYWCTADVGWITGHSYIVYGPLANGATTLIFEGVPYYPDCSRFWSVIDKHKVNIFYTAPTAIRAVMREGDSWVKKTSRASLRVLGSVGEPINPEAWLWFHDVVGEGRCAIADTWFQTETGGFMIAPLIGAFGVKPGSATKPYFGVRPAIVDHQGQELQGACEGALCIAQPWPGMARTIYGDHARFVQTYFSAFPGKYFTGDGAQRDADGYYWITGRVDDVINVSGHRLGTAEIEAALEAHPKVAEAAVVGYPHDLKGQGIYVYVTLNADQTPSDELRRELVKWVRQEIGPIASPDEIQWATDLPKTRSGKIMRRILRKIAANEQDSLGDTSTLADSNVISDLIANRMNQA
ncbi:acetyl-CoA synthetase [Rhodoblastus acidophilus]|uniref:acetate--CoA ligase n=1 Tax=Rhodoblastus acidophilus TaxID=1074 RepID=UPI0022251B9E|nr:acetate--CoA ligase [Rhodoblastus acidophilus]MCW2314595.1 acetyl-CoA synthetase [Rhodoblastus acidophilus]